MEEERKSEYQEKTPGDDLQKCTPVFIYMLSTVHLSP